MEEQEGHLLLNSPLKEVSCDLPCHTLEHREGGTRRTQDKTKETKKARPSLKISRLCSGPVQPGWQEHPEIQSSLSPNLEVSELRHDKGLTSHHNTSQMKAKPLKQLGNHSLSKAFNGQGQRPMLLDTDTSEVHKQSVSWDQPSRPAWDQPLKPLSISEVGSRSHSLRSSMALIRYSKNKHGLSPTTTTRSTNSLPGSPHHRLNTPSSQIQSLFSQDLLYNGGAPLLSSPKATSRSPFGLSSQTSPREGEDFGSWPSQRCCSAVSSSRFSLIRTCSLPHRALHSAHSSHRMTFMVMKDSRSQTMAPSPRSRLRSESLSSGSIARKLMGGDEVAQLLQSCSVERQDLSEQQLDREHWEETLKSLSSKNSQRSLMTQPSIGRLSINTVMRERLLRTVFRSSSLRATDRISVQPLLARNAAAAIGATKNAGSMVPESKMQSKLSSLIPTLGPYPVCFSVCVPQLSLAHEVIKLLDRLGLRGFCKQEAEIIEESALTGVSAFTKQQASGWLEATQDASLIVCMVTPEFMKTEQRCKEFTLARASQRLVMIPMHPLVRLKKISPREFNLTVKAQVEEDYAAAEEFAVETGIPIPMWESPDAEEIFDKVLNGLLGW